MSRRHSLAGVLAIAALLLAACGSQKEKSAIDGDPATPIPKSLTNLSPAPPRDPNKPLPKTSAVKDISTDLKTEPKIDKPSGDAPKELQGLDVVTGKGPIAKTGDKIEVQYTGVLFDSGTKFDASWKAGKPGAPFKVTLGQGGVIKGWDEGIPGMKVGGRRILVIPPDLAYGATGQPPKIPANASLVFAIDLKKIG